MQFNGNGAVCNRVPALENEHLEMIGSELNIKEMGHFCRLQAPYFIKH